MRILHTVETYHPAVGGMQEVVKRLSELLVQQGQDVTVATRQDPHRELTEINGVKIVGFDVKGNEVNGYKGRDIEKYKNFLLESDFDIIVNFAAQQWASDLVYDLLPKIKAKKVFVPTGFSGLFDPNYRAFFETFYKRMKNYDAHIFLSDEYRDIVYTRGHKVPNLFLIPSGASYEEFSRPTQIDIREKLGIPKDHFLVLHVGSHTGGKGHHIAINIFRQAKIDNASFVLVGNAPEGKNCKDACDFRSKMANRWPVIDTVGDWRTTAKSIIKNLLKGQIFKKYGKNKKVIVRSLNREETVAAYQSADLFLFPSQIECSPIVFFECMASRTPFLSSKVGNAAEIIRWSGAGEILPTVDHGSSVDAVDHLSTPILEKYYHDKSLRDQMANAGHEVWLKKFTWEKIAQQYLDLYSALIRNEKPKVFNPELMSDL